MNVIAQHKSTWWREPMVWLVIGLPLTAVLAGLVTLWIAARGADSLVAEDYYKQGLAIHRTLEQETRAASLGLKAQLLVRDGTLEIQLTGRLDTYPDQLELTLVHPTRQEQDLTLVIPAMAQGKYRIAMPPMSAGQRRVILQSKHQGWRLSGRTFVPMTSLRLDARPLPQP